MSGVGEQVDSWHPPTKTLERLTIGTQETKGGVLKAGLQTRTQREGSSKLSLIGLLPHYRRLKIASDSI